MPKTQQRTIEGLGNIVVIKKKGLKRINMRLSHNGDIKISIPYLVPYASAYSFAKSQKQWILTQKAKVKHVNFYNNMPIGKNHNLVFEQSKKLGTRINNNEIKIRLAPNDNLNDDDEVVIKIKQAIKRALTIEAKEFLPSRTNQLAEQYNYKINDISVKPMKTRWGHCSSQQNIVFNIYLLMLPDELIDYVICHELAHTLHMNHSQAFWNEVGRTTPDYKHLKNKIKLLQPNINTLYL
jgi:predicted metal-dependent hydrolase